MDVKTPLLSVEEPKLNSENSRKFVDLRCDFLSKLPEKIRRGLDPEAPFRFDFPTTTALGKGTPYSCFVLSRYRHFRLGIVVSFDCLDRKFDLIMVIQFVNVRQNGKTNTR